MKIKKNQQFISKMIQDIKLPETRQTQKKQEPAKRQDDPEPNLETV